MGCALSCCYESAKQTNPVMQNKPRKSDDYFGADKEKLRKDKEKKYGEE